MRAPASRPKTPRFLTPATRKRLGDWLAPLIVWITVTGFLLAIVAVLLGDRQ